MYLTFVRRNKHIVTAVFSELDPKQQSNRIGDLNARLATEEYLNGTFRPLSNKEKREHSEDAEFVLDIDLKTSGITVVNYEQLARTVVMLTGFLLGYNATLNYPGGRGTISADTIGGSFAPSLDAGSYTFFGGGLDDLGDPHTME